MGERYLMITWPDIQAYMDHPRWKDCIFCQSISGHPCPDSAYMVPEDVYFEINDPQLPPEYDNFTKYFNKIKRGQKVLVESYEDGKLYEVTAESSWLRDSMPCLLSNDFIDGINCLIVGVEK